MVPEGPTRRKVFTFFSKFLISSVIGFSIPRSASIKSPSRVSVFESFSS